MSARATNVSLGPTAAATRAQWAAYMASAQRMASAFVIMVLEAKTAPSVVAPVIAAEMDFAMVRHASAILVSPVMTAASSNANLVFRAPVMVNALARTASASLRTVVLTAPTRAVRTLITATGMDIAALVSVFAMQSMGEPRVQ